MNDTLLKFQEIIDEEIQAYEALGELYKIKQAVLTQGKNDDLWDIDAKIVQRAKNIEELNQKRKDVARYLGNENFTISEIIEKAKTANDSIADKLESQQARLKILANSLILQESTNITLIQHGLTMVGKTLDIIVGALLPHAKQYNKFGQNINCDKSLLSSVVEEA